MDEIGKWASVWESSVPGQAALLIAEADGRGKRVECLAGLIRSVESVRALARQGPEADRWFAGGAWLEGGWYGMRALPEAIEHAKDVRRARDGAVGHGLFEGPRDEEGDRTAWVGTLGERAIEYMLGREGVACVVDGGVNKEPDVRTAGGLRLNAKFRHVSTRYRDDLVHFVPEPHVHDEQLDYFVFGAFFPETREVVVTGAVDRRGAVERGEAIGRFGSHYQNAYALRPGQLLPLPELIRAAAPAVAAA